MSAAPVDSLAVTDRGAVTVRPGGTAVPPAPALDLDARPSRPTGREEAWRFTPLARLRGLLDEVPPGPDAVTLRIDAPEPTRVQRGSSRPPRSAPTDPLASRAAELAPETVVVTVPRGTALSAPVRISVTGVGGTVYSHLVVEVERGASAVVVLDHTGSATYSGLLELVVGDAASLTLITVQDWERDAVHAAAHTARVGRDAHYRHLSVTLGGDLVRLLPTVGYDAPGGDAELLGVFFTDAGQHQEARLLVDHSVPHCRSRVIYKGALQGEDAHSVWVGDVVIRAQALGTDTYELNRNLVLTDGARADSVPNLEIETGEIVGAGHASATGRFDAEQLFYLMSRGIAEAEARRLVVRGFFAEVLDRMAADAPDLHDRLLARVEELVGPGLALATGSAA